MKVELKESDREYKNRLRWKRYETNQAIENGSTGINYIKAFKLCTHRIWCSQEAVDNLPSIANTMKW